MTTLKTRLSEAQEIAKSLVGMFLYDTVVDTIVCLEGTQVIGGFLAESPLSSAPWRRLTDIESPLFLVKKMWRITLTMTTETARCAGRGESWTRW